MGKLCERPGCSDAAAMAYGFDVDRLMVWLAPREPDGDPLRAGSLCKRHADAMVVPRGWTLDDRREAVARLFRPAPTEDAPAPKRRRSRKAAASRGPTVTAPPPGVGPPRPRPPATPSEPPAPATEPPATPSEQSSTAAEPSPTATERLSAATE